MVQSKMRRSGSPSRRSSASVAIRNSGWENSSILLLPSPRSTDVRSPDPAAMRRPDQGQRASSVDQAVELAGVLAGDLVHNFGRQPGELLLDVFRGFGPNAVGVRVVRAPHHRLDADVVDQLGADRVELEGRL